MHTLKLRAVGSSTGVVLPKEMLNHLHAQQGQEIYAIETPSGFIVTALDPRVREQVKTGAEFIERYKDTFAALAK